MFKQRQYCAIFKPKLQTCRWYDAVYQVQKQKVHAIDMILGIYLFIFSNQKRFNNLRFEYESYFTPPEEFPDRPNYVHESDIGIVESVIEANISKVSRSGRKMFCCFLGFFCIFCNEIFDYGDSQYCLALK